MKKRVLWELLLIAALIFIDQFTKFLAVDRLSGNEGISIIKGVFRLYLLQGGNTGAAFGIFKGKFVLFVVLTNIIVLFIFYFLFKMPDTKHYLPIRIILLFITAGAIGNYIDRVSTYIKYGYNYVIDFLYFELIDFPIFNVADIYITVGAILLFIVLVFKYKENEFEFLKIKRNA